MKLMTTFLMAFLCSNLSPTDNADLIPALIPIAKRHLVTPSNHANASKPLILSMWIDKSLSIKDGLFDKVVEADVAELLDIIDAAPYGSRLYFGMIGEHTRGQLLMYENLDASKLVMPKRSRSQSADERRAQKRKLRALQKKSASRRSNPQVMRQAFMKRVRPLLDYSRTHTASQICEVVSLHKKLLKENDGEVRSVIVAVTDGLANGELCPLFLPRETELCVVNRANHNGAFERYRTSDFTSMQALLYHLFANY